MKFKIYLSAALFAALFYLSISSGTKTFAQENSADIRCKVADGSGTPLNVRASVNGKIVGKLKNGTIVYIIDESGDARDQSWSRIKLTLKGKAKGWVLTGLLDCE